jgi:hypothetical protein
MVCFICCGRMGYKGNAGAFCGLSMMVSRTKVVFGDFSTEWFGQENGLKHLVLSTSEQLYIFGSIGGFAVKTVGLMISICCGWRHRRQHTSKLYMLCNLRRV